MVAKSQGHVQIQEHAMQEYPVAVGRQKAPAPSSKDVPVDAVNFEAGVYGWNSFTEHVFRRNLEWGR